MEVAKRVELILKVSSPSLSVCLYLCWSARRVVEACPLFLQQDPQDSLVVLSGCGTSGRLAFLISVKVVLKCPRLDLAHCTPGIRKPTTAPQALIKLFGLIMTNLVWFPVEWHRKARHLIRWNLHLIKSHLFYGKNDFLCVCVCVVSQVSTERWGSWTRVWSIPTSLQEETGMLGFRYCVD